MASLEVKTRTKKNRKKVKGKRTRVVVNGKRVTGRRK